MIRMIYRLKSVFLSLVVVLLAFTVSACEMTSTTTQSPGFDYSDFAQLLVSDPNMQLNVSDDPYYLYYFGETCYHCNNIKQLVLAKILTLQEDQVYLVDVVSTESIMNGINVVKTPSLVKIENHQVISIYEGEESVLSVLGTLS